MLCPAANGVEGRWHALQGSGLPHWVPRLPACFSRQAGLPGASCRALARTLLPHHGASGSQVAFFKSDRRAERGCVLGHGLVMTGSRPCFVFSYCVVLDILLVLISVFVPSCHSHIWFHSCPHFFPEMNKVSPAPLVWAGQKSQHEVSCPFPWEWGPSPHTPAGISVH